MKHTKTKAPAATKVLDHLRELQMRFLVCFAVLTISSVIVYFFYEPILSILRAPLNETLYYSSPVGSFAFVMKICFMGALAITMPVIAYNLIMFIRPAFDKILSLKRVYAMTVTSAILSISGVIFAYVLILPGTLEFFGGFDITGISALISADNYLSFVTNIIITFVLIFQLPIVLTIIDKIKPLTPKKMLSLEKWVVIGSLIVSLITPFTYDLVTSLLVGLPIVVLYNISILIVIMQHRYYRRKELTAVKAIIVKPTSVDHSFNISDSFVESIASDRPSHRFHQPANNYTKTKIVIKNNETPVEQPLQIIINQSEIVDETNQPEDIKVNTPKLQVKVLPEIQTVKRITIS